MKRIKKIIQVKLAERRDDRDFKRKADNLIDPTFLDRALEGEKNV